MVSMRTPGAAGIRHFNRTVQERIGVLNDRFLGRSRPVSEARLLWEIGPDGSNVAALGARLRLDALCVARIVGSLREEGLVRTTVDGPATVVHLTAAGAAERVELDALSE